MPPEAWPAAQSVQTTSVPLSTKLMLSELCRQLPVFRNCHHAGNEAAAVWTSMNISTPLTAVSGLSSTNEPTRMLLPTFDAHANVRFSTPPSPEQKVHRMLTPPAWA